MHYKPKLLRSSDGITLVEIIISIAVLGAVIVPLMTLFVMSAEINHESNIEYKSILTAQKYIEEIKAMENIDTNMYVFNLENGCYERTVIQTDGKYGAEIKIKPVRDFLYSIEVLVMDEEVTINSITASKLIK